MLKISNVHKTFNPNTINEKKALNGVDLVLNEGDFVTVIGGNGAGKSTMLNMIAGVYPVDCGTITVDGIDVTKLPEHKRAKYIGRVFQDPMNGTAADMQILENLALAKRRGQHRGLKFGVTRKEKEEYIDVLKSLDLGLETRLTSKVGLLSGGQRQAVTLLMATLKKPKILLLDEHTAALDPKTAKKVLDLTPGLEGILAALRRCCLFAPPSACRLTQKEGIQRCKSPAISKKRRSYSASFSCWGVTPSAAAGALSRRCRRCMSSRKKP